MGAWRGRKWRAAGGSTSARSGSPAGWSGSPSGTARWSTAAGPDEVVVTAADGAVARLTVPFPPLVVDDAAADGGLAAHVLRPRRVGVLLVRLGGHAAGVFDGDRLVSSKVGSRQVHGRSAAGGWSQQRFARRREGQVRVALAAAADVAAAQLAPVAGRWTPWCWAVTGDRSTRCSPTRGWRPCDRWWFRRCSTCRTRRRAVLDVDAGALPLGPRPGGRPADREPDHSILMGRTGDLDPMGWQCAHRPDTAVHSVAPEIAGPTKGRIDVGCREPHGHGRPDRSSRPARSSTPPLIVKTPTVVEHVHGRRDPHRRRR